MPKLALLEQTLLTFAQTFVRLPATVVAKNPSFSRKGSSICLPVLAELPMLVSILGNFPSPLLAVLQLSFLRSMVAFIQNPHDYIAGKQHMIYWVD